MKTTGPRTYLVGSIIGTEGPIPGRGLRSYPLFTGAPKTDGYVWRTQRQKSSLPVSYSYFYLEPGRLPLFVQPYLPAMKVEFVSTLSMKVSITRLGSMHYLKTSYEIKRKNVGPQLLMYTLISWRNEIHSSSTLCPLHLLSNH